VLDGIGEGNVLNLTGLFENGASVMDGIAAAIATDELAST
jgi:hypothetical protein